MRAHEVLGLEELSEVCVAHVASALIPNGKYGLKPPLRINAFPEVADWTDTHTQPVSLSVLLHSTASHGTG